MICLNIYSKYGNAWKIIGLFHEKMVLSHSLNMNMQLPTVLPAKSDSDIMFCLQSYQGLIIDRSHVY